MTRLGDLVSIRKGKKPDLISSTPRPDYRRLLQIEDLRRDATPKFCPATSDEVMVSPSDIVLAWDGANAGTSNFGLSGVVGSTLALLRPKTSNLFTPYLGRFLQAQEEHLRARCKGATVPHIDSRALEALEVPLPSIAEQQRVAHLLNTADELRHLRERSMSQLESLAQSIFYEMFGDPRTNPRRFPRCHVSSLIRADDSINYGVVQPGDNVDSPDGVPLVRVGDLHGGRVSHEHLKRIDPGIEAAYKRSRLRGDEVLVSCVGSVGVIALATERERGFNVARAIARIPLADIHSRVFLATYLSMDYVQQYFTSELRTVSQPTLNIKQLSETPIMLPPPELQREFEQRVLMIDRAREASDQSLTRMNTLFASLQHRAFAGGV
jgi:type I restriction enzyme, S subunit